MDDVMN